MGEGSSLAIFFLFVCLFCDTAQEDASLGTLRNPAAENRDGDLLLPVKYALRCPRY